MKKITLLLLALAMTPVMAMASASEGTIDGTNRYAWSDKIGVIDMANVKVTSSGLTGTATNAQVGIISFNDPTFKVTNDGIGNLKGSAYGTASGLINFAGVKIDSEGYFGGIADGGFMSGKIYFDCTNNSNCPSASSARVRTDWRYGVVSSPTAVATTIANAVTAKNYSSCDGLNDYISYSRCVSEIDSKLAVAPTPITEEPKASDGDYSITINNGVASTNKLTVQLKLTASKEAVDMVVAKDNNFGFLAKEKVATTKEWQLEDSEGSPQYVYVKFYDAGGKPLKVVANSITLNKRQGNEAAEKDALIAFRIMYAREPKADSQMDNEALKIMAYGLPGNIARDLEMEKSALARFIKYYKHAPTVNEEWNIVKGYAYAGASIKLNTPVTESKTETVTETSVKNCGLKLKLTKNLDLGASGAEVSNMQTVLQCLGLLSADYKVAGKFDKTTEDAVMAFQKEHKLICKDGTYCGYVGPATRAKFNALTVATKPAVSTEVAKPSGAKPFTRNLTVDMTGDDVTKLQELLAKDKELYPEGKVTGKFGPLTEEAVKRFQKKYDLKCADTTYCGYIGPATRNKLNELY